MAPQNQNNYFGICEEDRHLLDNYELPYPFLYS